MGYQRQPKVYKLTFADPEMNGLVVRTKGLTLGELLEVTTWRDGGPEDLEKLFRLFSEKLVEWNLEDDEGTPIPATYESLLIQEDNFVLSIADAWMETVAGVPTPLGQNSNGGRPFLEASLPMEALSESQAS